jgi:hypothetical protein
LSRVRDVMSLAPFAETERGAGNVHAAAARAQREIVNGGGR